MATTDSLKTEVARREQTATVYSLIEQMKPQMGRALPAHLSPDRFARIALTTIRQNPALQRCTPESLIGALMTCAQLGLEPGPLGHAYLVPFGKEVTFIPGYKGLIDLARRSGHIESIIARKVGENDEFDYEYGLNERLVHKPNAENPGRTVYWYALAKYVGGGHNFVVLNKAAVDAARQASRAKDRGPWVTHYDEMGLKTAIRRLWPWLPLSTEMAVAATQDEAVRTDPEADLIDLTPADYEEQQDTDSHTPEVPDEG